MIQVWHHHKDEDILTYRDKSFASKYTGQFEFQDFDQFKTGWMS